MRKWLLGLGVGLAASALRKTGSIVGFERVEDDYGRVRGWWRVKILGVSVEFWLPISLEK